MTTPPDISDAAVQRIEAGLNAQAAQVAEILAPVPAELLQQDWYKSFERDEQLYNAAGAMLRALRNCARMTTLGSAGIHPQSESYGNEWGHLTLNLWTHTGEGWGFNSPTDPQDADGRRDLDTFIKKAMAVKS